MQYKEISRIESTYNYPNESIGVFLSASIKRELTPKETIFIDRKLREILSFIRETSIEKDPESQRERVEEREKLLACFDSPIYIKEIPNQYGGSNPWFEVWTKKGLIIIGWRKRVINIDWSNSDIKITGKVLFKGENTTGAHDYESVHYVHAGGYQKAKEYIQKLLS